MRTSWSRYVLLTAALVAAPSVLLADDPPSSADREALFKKLDGNSDGQLTSDEVPEEQQRLFKRMLRTSDKDSDGKLSHDEFLAGTKEQARPAMPEGGGGEAPAPSSWKPCSRVATPTATASSSPTKSPRSGVTAF